jgi:hypothetical protein
MASYTKSIMARQGIKNRYGFAIKNHGMAWYREENFTSQFQIRNGKSTY